MESTLDGLLKAYVGECQARHRYTSYASTAKKEGYEQVAEIFSITADNEREHAGWFFKMIKEVAEKQGADLSKLTTNTDVPLVRGTTLENLEAAISGETHEFSSMYPQISDMALKDGFAQIAARVKSIAIAEEHHAQRYTKLLENFKKDMVFKREEAVFWMCRECGYIHFGKVAPEACPSCGHAQAFYQLLSENY